MVPFICYFCFVLGIATQKVGSITCDFHSIFRTPQDYQQPKDFDNLGILERANFSPGTEEYAKTGAVSRNEIPRAYANAQINLRFGEDAKATPFANMLAHYAPFCLQQRVGFGANPYLASSVPKNPFYDTNNYLPDSVPKNTIDYYNNNNNNNNKLASLKHQSAPTKSDLNAITQFLAKLIEAKIPADAGSNIDNNKTKEVVQVEQQLNVTTNQLPESIKVDGFDVIPVNCTKCDQESKLLVTYPIADTAQNVPRKREVSKKKFDLDVDDLSEVKPGAIVDQNAAYADKTKATSYTAKNPNYATWQTPSASPQTLVTCYKQYLIPPNPTSDVSQSATSSSSPYDWLQRYPQSYANLAQYYNYNKGVEQQNHQ